MSTIYSHISSNKRATVIFMTLFIAFVAMISVIISRAFFGDNPLMPVIAAIISAGTSIVGYYNSDKIALAANGARPLSRQENEYVHNLVENLCIGAGLPMPRIYIIDSPSLNAFATGRDPKNSAICFTSGLIQNLDKLELEGVIAHELSHIGNYDIRLMTVVGVLAGSITILVNWLTHAFSFGGSRKGSGGAVFLILGILAIVLAPIIATIIQLAISRNREYLADASGALITRYPAGLASALNKIAQSNVPLASASPTTAHMFIANPFKSTSLFKLFSTHPPVEERIKKLSAM
jgi:heat shock protein HtpX